MQLRDIWKSPLPHLLLALLLASPLTGCTDATTGAGSGSGTESSEESGGETGDIVIGSESGDALEPDTGPECIP